MKPVSEKMATWEDVGGQLQECKTYLIFINFFLVGLIWALSRTEQID